VIPYSLTENKLFLSQTLLLLLAPLFAFGLSAKLMPKAMEQLFENFLTIF
jgi:hypothetical protein